MADLITTEQISKKIDEIVDKKLQDYFRMSRPGFNIESGMTVPGHGVGEFCMTTDTIQGLHFYKHGHSKFYANKSIEIYAGEEAGEKDMGIVIESENGNIKITAKMDNLILQGNNVKIQANDTIQLKAKRIVDMVAPTIYSYADNLVCIGTLNAKFLGGTTELYAQTEIEMSSGVDSLINLSLIDKIINLIDEIEKTAIFI
tara:strand:- start:1939 stop:2541 length:603 start_codon:yes stop_codon:yes gene_type:complete